MKAGEITPEFLRRLDRAYPEIIKHIEHLNPDIYRDGSSYSCVSQNYIGFRITGKGKTAHEALESWEQSFNMSMAYEES